MNDFIKRITAISVVILVVLALLWWKGGEFFCRLRGDAWDSNVEVCFNPFEE